MRGHIRQRANAKTWAIVIDLGRDENGKRERRWHSGFKTRKEAEAALPKLLTSVQEGTYVQPDKMTLRAFLEDEWLPAIERSDRRPTTVASYRALLTDHVIPALGSVKIQKLGPRHLDKLYTDLLTSGRRSGKGGLSPRTVRYVHTVLRAALQDAMRRGIVPRNVSDLVDPPSQARPEMTAWTAEELHAFLVHVKDDRLSAAWAVLGMTGLRRGEALGLKWADIDLEGGRMTIQRALIVIGYKMHFAAPKTDKGRRTIEVDRATIALLKAHRVAQLQERLKWGEAYKDDDLVFARENGEPIQPDSLTKTFKARVKSAKIRPIRLHDLRHTHASLALAAGIHPKVVQERLGHSSIQITLDTYSHTIPSMQRDAAEQVAALVNGGGA